MKLPVQTLNLLMTMLEKDPKKRITPEQALCQDFFQIQKQQPCNDMD